jgi:integrase
MSVSVDGFVADRGARSGWTAPSNSPAPLIPNLRHAAARAGVGRWFAPHRLRHAHAVEMAREGVSLIGIQRQLGHSRSSSGAEAGAD